MMSKCLDKEVTSEIFSLLSQGDKETRDAQYQC